MAFVDLYSELTGVVPKLSEDYARTLINRAWRDVRRKNLWSFQLFEANWVSPSLINAGQATVTQGLTTVTFDATASAAIIAANSLTVFPTTLLQRQFRVSNSTIYNIWAYDATGGVVTLTLDRPYTGVSGSTGYMIYQIYYPAPMSDFLMWEAIVDIVNFNVLNLTVTRKEINRRDPQRTIFYLPTHCVYYQQNQNPDYNYGVPLFELWGGILYPITYQLYGIRKGTPLVEDTDTLPPAVGEDCVMALSRKYAYEWAESMKGDMPRNTGSDYRFLMGVAEKDYIRLYREYRQQDRETVDNWYDVLRHKSWLSNVNGYYNSIGASASPGAPW